jgi:Mg2+-importing ATPase
MNMFTPVPAEKTLLTPAAPAGLTSAEARERLAKSGPNDPTPVRRGALALELLTLFLNPLVIILLVASLVSAFLGQPVDSAIIFLVILMGASINFDRGGNATRSNHGVSRDFGRQRDGDCPRNRHRKAHGFWQHR